MNPVVEFLDVSYWYPNRDKPAIADLNLRIDEGELLLITGSSGSGKSTLCRCINGIVPRFTGGRFKGRVIVNDMDTLRNSTSDIAKEVGMVFQDPENQIIMDSIENEISFGLENLQLLPGVIDERLNEILEYLGIQALRQRKTGEISGGEKQKIVIASVLAMKPKIIVLDEPLSQLDFEGANSVLQMIGKLNRELGITIIIAEHRIQGISEFADRIFDMDRNSFVDGDIRIQKKRGLVTGRKIRGEGRKIAIETKNLSFSYANSDVLKDINLKIHEGEFVAITGNNGSGKTTLVKHFNGLLKPKEGGVRVFGIETKNLEVEELAKIVGYVPQNPNELLFSDTVIDEVRFTMKNLGAHTNPEGILNELNLSDFRLSYPRDLSSGQRQRVAIASVAAGGQDILILDEPTRGMDNVSRKNLVNLLGKMKSAGKTIILVSHDMELIEESAERIITLENGEIISDCGIAY